MNESSLMVNLHHYSIWKNTKRLKIFHYFFKESHIFYDNYL
jgi:hypothetical protein